MPQEPLAECVERIDVLLGKIESLTDAGLRTDVQEIVQRLLDYHGAALARLLSLVRQADRASPAVIEQLADDELVASLLVLHGVHPADVETRVLTALDQVRPYLQSHSGNVELAEVADGVVRLRMQGSCHGCPSSAATLKLRVEQAIFQAAPEIDSVELVEAPAPPAAASGFVAMEKLTLR